MHIILTSALIRANRGTVAPVNILAEPTFTSRPAPEIRCIFYLAFLGSRYKMNLKFIL